MTTPVLREWTVRTTTGDATTFTGQLLGLGTSAQDYHQHPEDFAPRGTRCSACRWFEVTIYRTDGDADARYVVHTIGRSAIPGEEDRHNVTWTDAPDEIIEVLTQRTRGAAPTLPSPSARALAQAGTYDEKILDAYRDRRVA